MANLKSASCARAAVVGLGNPYRTDDGVGVAVLRHLLRDGLWVMGDERDEDPSLITDHLSPVDLIEAVHDGFRLAEAICGYERVLILDAAPGLPPGEVVRFPLENLPARAGYFHGVGLREALEALTAERMPRVEILAIGVPPDPQFGEGLSPQVAAAVPRALAEVRRWLSE